MIKIVTDTAADINLTQAKEMGIGLVPLRVSFNDSHPYDQMADETFERFYELLDECKDVPTTSQPSPADYLPIFNQAREDGDSVIVVTISSGISGTYQSALIAKEMSGYENIHVINSYSASMGEKLLVDYAIKMVSEGKDLDEIVETLTDASHRIKLIACLDTLKYLRKGGRIPRSAEIIGYALGIKPLITVNKEGTVSMAGKARGHAGAIANMIKIVEENPNFDPETPIYYGFTQNPVPCTNFRKIMQNKFGKMDYQQHSIGPIIGTHVGPNAVLLVYLEAKV